MTSTPVDLPVCVGIAFTPCFLPPTSTEPIHPAVVLTLTHEDGSHSRAVVRLPDGIEDDLGLAVARARWTSEHPEQPAPDVP